MKKGQGIRAGTKEGRWITAVATAMVLGALTMLTWSWLTGPVTAAPTAPSEPPVIALTFDDGPSPEYTPKILALLTRYHAHATFFVLGSEVARFPKIAREIVQQGSVLANHGYDHVNFFQVGVRGVLRDLERANRLLAQERLPATPFYRPPFGNANAALVRALNQRGYTVALWSIDTRDWARPGAAFITRRVLSEAKPGAIILMHDSGGNRADTVNALAAILPVLESEGYQLVTLPEYVRRLHLHTPTELPLKPAKPRSAPPPAPSPAGPWT
ncbi:MAG: polysaccharide deacetylase family protein [Firmicutes bacterium]|nr:polysaccharide deacetylase family protein [Bacillota bacterium]